MELIIIGSGTAALQPRRGPSGYVLKTGDQIFLLDGGTGTLLKCLEAGVSYKDIDKIFYTHLHPDHTIDLIPFLFSTRHTPGFARTKKLELHGPVGFKDFFNGLVGLYGKGLVEGDYEIEVVEMAQNNLSFERLKITTKLMKHSEGAIGYRFELNDKIFVYSGDTDFCEGIIALAQNADVLLLECSFPDEMKVKGHLIPTEAGKIASRAEVDRLILTHLYPPCDEVDILEVCRREFDGEIKLAEDLMRVEI
jgi:ribonuclease BN (tRNA processing enzyme)